MRTNDSPSETETLHTMSETKSPASAALGVDAPRHEPAYVLAFDTANEVIAIGVGVLHEEAHAIELVAHAEIEARRQSNTQLIPRIDALLAERGIRARGHRVRVRRARPRLVHRRAHRHGDGKGHRERARGGACWRVLARRGGLGRLGIWRTRRGRRGGRRYAQGGLSRPLSRRRCGCASPRGRPRREGGFGR